MGKITRLSGRDSDAMTVYDALSQAFEPGIVYPGSNPGMERHQRDFVYSMPEGAVPAAIALPKNVEQLSTILRICNEQGVSVTPQGGLTGLVGGAVPEPGGVALSVERMRSVIEIDASSATMTVEAGTPLETVQNAADEAGLLFPLDLGARGSATVGGNAATNAGGNRVLRYGMMRDLVMGMEVVLADGTIVTSLNKMIKNNTGYDFKNLFMGSEGTLGIISKLVLRLVPKPRSTCTAFCGVHSYENAMKLLARARTELAGTLSAFEVLWPSFYALMKQSDVKLPLAGDCAFYVLLDALGSDQKEDQARFEMFMEGALEEGIIADAVIAQSGKDTKALWDIRDGVGEFPRLFGPFVAFDVSVPTGEIAKFTAFCEERLSARMPSNRTVWFGHVADSNVHLMTNFDGSAPRDAIKDTVYEAVREWHGSISAEHGIGTEKRAYLSYSRSPEELSLMRTLKSALDPKGILNPGKVLAK